MTFSLKPEIVSVENLCVFFSEWHVGKGDLILTNEYVLKPALNGGDVPCDVLYQERYGTGEPSDKMVDSLLSAMGDQSYDRVIAIGGGTVIDIAKLLVFGSGVRCADIFEQSAALIRKSKLLILPSTCGTGSEVTGISIIEFVDKKTKLGLSLPTLFADQAVLVPPLLATLPYDVFATSSIDALIHAVESYVSPKATEFSRAFGARAIELILKGYRKLEKTGRREVPQNTEDFLVASTLAGAALGNSGCAAVHALSYPIGGGYHVPHGKANYMVFSAVFDAYRAKDADLSAVEEIISRALGCRPAEAWAELFALLAMVLDCPNLTSVGVKEAVCGEMAESVIKNQQRLLANNPVALSQEEIYGIYKQCL